ncbi:predicted protein [Arabidopsis lyrata subsp. lyrata]|uniref:Predicted protein n=1 Tax=Arabidopsis lyrata subsp. lyrata TaxID=81972 RepID=D7LCW3_ARALL|nr:predicted protein [Arabidopsis lyrata subsp. lyrata]
MGEVVSDPAEPNHRRSSTVAGWQRILDHHLRSASVALAHRRSCSGENLQSVGDGYNLF